MFETIQSHMQQLNNLAETILPAINDVRTTVQGMSRNTFGQMAVGGDSSVHKYSPNKKYQDFHYRALVAETQKGITQEKAYDNICKQFPKRLRSAKGFIILGPIQRDG